MNTPGSKFSVFQYAQVHELRSNEKRKGPWYEQDGTTFEQLEDEVLYHTAKLVLASQEKNLGAILEYAADVANCALILADQRGAIDLDLVTEDHTLRDYEQAKPLHAWARGMSQSLREHFSPEDHGDEAIDFAIVDQSGTLQGSAPPPGGGSFLAIPDLRIS